ncbi:kinesin-like protein KIF18A [Folsomia candida]|nr:kinesin-like protein KIF18A [Folsomia candida]
MCYIPSLSEAKESKNISTNKGSPYADEDAEDRHIDSINVIVRIRPKNRDEEVIKPVVYKTSETSLIFDPKEKDTDFFYKGKRQVLRNDFGKKRPNKNLIFGFDYVYGQDSTNEEIFEISLKGLINKVLEGFNCTVFAYGATGSGKTYTMLGSAEAPGITVLMAEELFRRLSDMESDEFTHDIKVSYLEVYNETIKDLFNPQKELSIREDGKRGLRIPQLTVHQPEGPQELLRLLRNGNGNRSQHATDFNAESSRSHAVFEISVLMHQHSPTDRFKKRTATSRLFMVDLAGSEKGSVNIVDGMRQREGANINKSLLALSNCINALADGKTHIPYRNSKLTRLLKDSLSGNCVTVMIANVSPGSNTFEDTHNTLHYANRAKNIKVSCKQNRFSEELIEEVESSNKIKDLQNEVRILSQELADERRKHQATRELLECQIGDSDEGDGEGRGGGFGDPADSRLENYATLLGSGQKGQKIVEQVGGKVPASADIVQDPVAVDHFVELLKEKIRVMKSFTEMSVSLRLHEWRMNWKKLEVDSAEVVVGRPDTSDTQHFLSFTKLMNNQSALETHHPDLTGATKDLQTNLLNLNMEIENVHKTCLNSLEKDAPFVNQSFEEFLRHKEMGMELGTLENLVKFHQQLEKYIFQELKNSQLHRFHLLRFTQRLVRTLKEKGTLNQETEKKFQALLTSVYDPSSATTLEPPPLSQKKRIDLKVDFEKLENIFHNPVINFPRNEPIIKTCSVLRLSSPTAGATSPSSQLLVTSSSASASVIRINETSAKDTSESSEEDEQQMVLSISRNAKYGNINSRSDGDTTFRLGINCPDGISSPLRENKENYCDDPDPPISLGSSIDSEDAFLKEISEEEEEERQQHAEQMSNSATVGGHHNDQNRGGDNHHENNNASSRTSLSSSSTTTSPPHSSVAVKHRGKETRSKSNSAAATPLNSLHRGRATTDLTVAEKSMKSGNATRSLLSLGKEETCPSGKVSLSKKQNNTLRRIPRLIKKPPDPGRPYTFCYDETSTSSFDCPQF